MIAAKRLRDPNFYKTVVLMVEHGADGAMGLVINRPSSVTFAHALSEHFKLPETDDLVYVGGPVEPSALFILHNSAELDRKESPLIPGVFVGSRRGRLRGDRAVIRRGQSRPAISHLFGLCWLGARSTRR